MIRAGELRQRVEIQEATATNARGVVTRTWTTNTTRPARVRPLHGREALLAKQVDSELTHEVQLRYWPSLTTAHRFKIGTRTLGIVDVVNVESRDIEQLCMCKEDV